ncbi:hypothetical protein M2440_000473 [Methylorubrum extorquens]|nr:hypothetical protein [Methylorubrum extorquens]
MAHPLLSWALPSAAYLSAALILASSAPFGRIDLPPLQTVAVPVAADPVPDAPEETVAAIAEKAPEAAPDAAAPPAEALTESLAEWMPQALPAPTEVRFGTASLFWLPNEAPTAALAQVVPLPVRRPAELTRLGAADALRRAERMVARRSTVAVAPAQVEDTRTFFEKLLGVEKPATPAPALAYAALENGAAESAARRALTTPLPAAPHRRRRRHRGL